MPASSSESSISSLEEEIGYRFGRSSLPIEALTHRTYSHENPGSAPFFNERLEFLGDSVVGLVIGEELFRRFPELDEGKLSKMKAALVRDKTLASIAEKIGLGLRIRLGKGEEKTGGRRKPTLLADAFEALMAAVYLDGGMTAAKKVIGLLFDEEIAAAADRGGLDDPKTELQELVHRLSSDGPDYRLVEETGPDHDKTFTIEVLLGNRVAGTGSGPNKKEAEKAAARAAIRNLSRRQS